MDFSRRTFLAAAAGSVVSSVVRGAAASPADGFVDAHSHIWTDDVAKYPLVNNQPVSKLAPRTFTADELLAIARPVGVSRVVLIQHRPYFGVDNRYLVDVIAAYPGVFSGVACIDAEQATPEREMQRLKGLGFRGFRIQPGEGGAARWIDSPGINAMWSAAAREGLAICPLLGAEELGQVDEMCRKYPETTVVVDHFARIGMTGDFPEKDVQALVGLKRYHRVNVKVSAFYFLGRKKPPYDDLAPLIRRVLDAFGPDRLMWGSDCPYQLGAGNNYAASLELIQKGLDFLIASDREALLRKTATRVFFS
ncbi:MAG TPA: amidohydrolase family protein [Caulifigura sp.]|jgi:predicted TIM-barrel fold metal-dependent hydrolase|nr:amidohydrolase family protein [Caulifigura sp.]